MRIRSALLLAWLCSAFQNCSCRALPLALSLVLALSLPVLPLYGQQSPFTAIQGNTDQGIPLPQNSALLQRQDPVALQEILAFRNAVSLGSWIDMQGTGVFTSTAFNSGGGNTTENATLWLQNQSSRLDVESGQGTQSIRLSGVYGAVLHANGQMQPIDARDAAGGLVAFPRLMAASLPAPNVMLIDYGIVVVDGVGLHRISIESPWPGNQVDATSSPLTTVTDLYFDPQTHLLTKSAYATVGSKATSERYLCVITYGDYRAVNGMQIPFLYRESLNGQILWTLQLNQVQLNQGLSQSEFQF